MTMFFSGLFFGVGVAVLIDYLIDQHKKQELLEEELRALKQQQAEIVRNKRLDEEEAVNEMLSELPHELWEGETDLSYEHVLAMYHDYYDAYDDAMTIEENE